MWDLLYPPWYGSSSSFESLSCQIRGKVFNSSHWGRRTILCPPPHPHPPAAKVADWGGWMWPLRTWGRGGGTGPEGLEPAMTHSFLATYRGREGWCPRHRSYCGGGKGQDNGLNHSGMTRWWGLRVSTPCCGRWAEDGVCNIALWMVSGGIWWSTAQWIVGRDWWFLPQWGWFFWVGRMKVSITVEELGEQRMIF
jgi:hypothetical protein